MTPTTLTPSPRLQPLARVLRPLLVCLAVSGVMAGPTVTVNLNTACGDQLRLIEQDGSNGFVYGSQIKPGCEDYLLAGRRDSNGGYTLFTANSPGQRTAGGSISQLNLAGTGTITAYQMDAVGQPVVDERFNGVRWSLLSAPTNVVNGAFDVGTRDINIEIVDSNRIQDDFFDLFLNDKFVGAVNNLPGGSVKFPVTLQSGLNVIELRLTALQGFSTGLTIRLIETADKVQSRFFGELDIKPEYKPGVGKIVYTVTAP